MPTLTHHPRSLLIVAALAAASWTLAGCEDSAGIGALRPKIDVQPSPVVFDTVPLGVRAERTVTIENRGDFALDLGAIDWRDGGSADFRLVDAEALPDKIEPGATATFVVAFTPSSLGEVSATLKVASDDPETPELDVPVQGTRRQGPVLITCVESADIPIAPKCEQGPRIDFGDVNLEETFEAKLVLRSEGTDPVSVTSLALDSGSASTFTIVTASTAFELPVGARHEVVVRYAPIEQLPAEGSITLASSDPENATITTSLLGNGTEPWLCISPRSVDFGSVGVGQTREETIEISNCGSGDTVKLTELEILEPNSPFSVVNTLAAPVDLPAVDGIAYQAKIRFAPAQVGDSTARFRAHSDKGRATARLSAGSAGCQIAAFPTRVELSLFDGRARTVTFSNSGADPCRLGGLQLDPEGTFEFSAAQDVDDVTLDPGDVVEVEVFIAIPAARETEAELRLMYWPESNLTQDPSFATATIVGTDVIMPECGQFVEPSEIRFGSQTPGTERVVGLVVNSACVDDVALAAGSDPAFTLQQGSGIYLVRFAPTSGGTATGTITVTTTDENVGTISVPVSGYAGSTTICVQPENIDFGDVQTDATQSFTISACATEAVTVERLDFVRVDAEIEVEAAPALPFTLAAGTSRAITVRYTPLDNAGDTAVLEVGSNDPVRPSIDVRITGGRNIVPVSAGRFLYYWQIGGHGNSESNVMRQPLQGDLTPEPFAGPAAGNASCAGCHAVSPDGRFVAITGDTFVLRFFDAQTKSEFVAPLSLADGLYVSWRPDVNTDPPYQFAYTGDGDIQKASLFTGAIGPVPGASELDAMETMPSWGPDGKIAFVRGSSDPREGGGGGPGAEGALDILLVDEDGGVAVPLAGASANAQGNFYPSYSPNGAWIAFTQSAQAGGSIAPPDGRIRLVRTDNSGTVEMLEAANGTHGSSSYPTWSRDGTFLSFSSTRPGGRGHWDIYMLPVDPTSGAPGTPFALEEANSVGFDHAAQWSP